MSPNLDDVLAPLRARGGRTYGGEAVTVTDHVLQAAVAAEADDAPPALVAAALLHDLGWVLPGGPRDHEARGADFLAEAFGPEVVEPVRLHVAAKRYLCATEADYAGSLSAASRRTMAAQGGVMAGAEAAGFAGLPYAAEAVRLRRYDDGAKVPGRVTPDLEHFAPVLAGLLTPQVTPRR